MRVGLLLLIGLPGCGKTTLAKSLKDLHKLCDRNVSFIHVCYDELITASNQIFEKYEWKKARSSIAKKVENLVASIKSQNFENCPLEFANEVQQIKSSDFDIVLILDDNMYYRSMRYTFYQIAKNHKIGFCQVFFVCSVENSLLKNSLRKPAISVLPNIVKKMFNKIEPPRTENNWEQFSIIVDAFTEMHNIVYKLLPVLNESLLNCNYIDRDSSEQQKLSSLENKINVIHQVDIALRNIVSCKIKEKSMQNLKKHLTEYSREINEQRSQILSDIKSGIICIPYCITESIKNGTFEQTELINFLNSFF